MVDRNGLTALSGCRRWLAQAARRRRRASVGLEIEEITVTAQKREENIQEVRSR